VLIRCNEYYSVQLLCCSADLKKKKREFKLPSRFAMYRSSIYRNALKGKITRSFLYLQNELMLHLECLGDNVSVKIPFQ